MSASALCVNHLSVLVGIHVGFEPDSLRDAHVLMSVNKNSSKCGKLSECVEKGEEMGGKVICTLPGHHVDERNNTAVYLI